MKMFMTLRRSRLLRSAGVTFALAYALIFVVSGAIFLSFVWFHAIQTMQKSHIAAISTDAAELQSAWHRGGIQQLRDKLRERIAEDLNRENVYLLVDHRRLRLVGNISCWPIKAPHPDTFYTLTGNETCDPRTIEMIWHVFPDGSRLIVGRDIRSTTLLRSVLTEGLLWASLMSIALAVGGALMVRRLFRNIINTIAETSVAITRGDLTQRLPLSGNEIDSVSRTINIMLDRITRLMEGIRQVSNAIAHDLRTPITRARNTLEDAATHAPSVETLKVAVENAVKELDDVSAVFEALLRIAQIESGAQRSAFTTKDLRMPLEDIADLYRASAEARQIALLEELPDKVPFYGDALLIQQAVANLLDNAIKFSPSDTTIVIGAKFEGDALILYVIDQGVGMEPEDLKRASERFFRADSARHMPGTGLGLALVHAVAQLHDGTLDMIQQEKGLKIVLRLPCQTSSNA